MRASFLNDKFTLIITWILIGVTAVLSLFSIASLESMHVNVVTQSPFFLYNNKVYIISIVTTLTVILLLMHIRGDHHTVIPLLILWALILMAPYMVYAKSLPIYNDQLGFAAEALSGILLGHVEPLQGEPSSLGHAYFTTMFTLVSGLDPLLGVVVVQLILPIVYVLPLLAIRRRSFNDAVFVLLIVLAALINPILYGRTPYAQSYLVLFTVYLYNRYSEMDSERKGFPIVIIIIVLLIYIAYAISDPTSLIIPAILLIAAVFDRRFVSPALLTAVTWFAINLVFYLSGSLYSALMQLMALIEQPTNPVPSLIVPAVNPVMKLYDYVRELTMFLAFLIGLLVSIMIILRRFLSAHGWYRNDLVWVALYFILVTFQAAALSMSRWGMVPYSIYVLTALQALVLIGMNHRWFKYLMLVIAVVLIVLSPVVKWGFSPIAYPTAMDITEANFITTHVTSQTVICASGAHELLWFYYWLYNVNAPINYINPIPIATPNQLSQCRYIAVFYRAFNTYRLDITENQLMSAISELNNNYGIIYKSSIWTIWLK
jgi:hypothetical protein